MNAPQPAAPAAGVDSTRMTLARRWRRMCLTGLALALVVTSGCSAQSSPTPATTATPDFSEAGPTADTSLIDVGGHQLYLSCEGRGSPTVVVIHGWVDSDEYVPHAHVEAISTLLDDDYRVCIYDRRNTGSSETVDAVQTPGDMLHDMEGVLQGGDIEPPYILMAGSFGGLLAYEFLNRHPDQVTGLVMLDAMIPDELALDEYLAPEDTFRHYREEDMCCAIERISQYELINGLQQYIGQEPTTPMIYLAAALEPRVSYNWTTPEYDARYPAVLEAFVDRFSPGELRWVQSHHGDMNDVVADEIAQAVRDVDTLTSVTDR